MKELGVKYYRFSISWSRIYINGSGIINQDGVDHYNLLIDSLIAIGITPVVTLYHWDLPIALENAYGGWASSSIVKDFENYADTCFNHFGDRVRWWITINEPWTYCIMGYEAGKFAPGRCSDRTLCSKGNSSIDAYLCGHHALLAHSRAATVYKTRYKHQNGYIGIALNQDWAEPLTDSDEDVAAANRRNIFSMGWFADPIFLGDYPALMRELVGSRLPKFTEDEKKMLMQSSDFHFVNHYSTSFAYAVKSSGEGWFADQHVATTNKDISGQLIGPQGGSEWLNLVPWGFYKMLAWNSERYGNPPIIVTENGCDILGESLLPLTEALNDTFRVNYLKTYIEQLDKARMNGMRIFGYFVWSLMDNFEWADGYNSRFGLYHVDYSSKDLTRYPKLSSLWYRARISDSASQHLPNKRISLFSVVFKLIQESYEYYMDNQIYGLLKPIP